MNQYLGSHEDEINVIEHWHVLKRKKRLFGAVVIVGTIVAIIYSIMTPVRYKSKAVIMPIGGKDGSGVSSMISSFGGLASLVSSMSDNRSEQLMAILQSRTLAENVIMDLHLMPMLFDGEESIPANADIALEKAVRRLKEKYVTFEDDRRLKTVAIVTEFGDPKVTADIANAYVSGLQGFINDGQLTMAKRNRIFIERQLALSKHKLLKAGKMLNEFYEREGVSNVESKLDVALDDEEFRSLSATVEAFPKLSAAIGPSYQEFIERGKRLEAMRDELRIVKDVPQQVYLEYLTLNRKMLEQIHQILSQQYEASKIEEAKNDLAFQIIDIAKKPISRFKPKRKKIVMVGFMISVFVGLFVVFFVNYVEKLKQKILPR